MMIPWNKMSVSFCPHDLYYSRALDILKGTLCITQYITSVKAEQMQLSTLFFHGKAQVGTRISCKLKYLEPFIPTESGQGNEESCFHFCFDGGPNYAWLCFGCVWGASVRVFSLTFCIYFTTDTGRLQGRQANPSLDLKRSRILDWNLLQIHH